MTVKCRELVLRLAREHPLWGYERIRGERLSAPEITKWLAHPRRKRWHLHFTPTSSAWINLVERWAEQRASAAVATLLEAPPEPIERPL